MNRSRKWLEIIIGLLLGVSLGLTISWWVVPNSSVDLTPSALRVDYKDEYRIMIASAYESSHDLGRAEARLSLLKDADITQALIDQVFRLRSGQSQSTLYSSDPERAVYVLAFLANSISQASSPQENTATTPGTSTRRAATMTMSPFVLYDQEIICDPNHPGGRTSIQVQDSGGDPLGGIEILITWEDGQERIFTGYKPELGLGTADFEMQPGTIYTVQILPASLPVGGLVAQDCFTEAGSTIKSGYLIVFSQP